LVHTVCRITSEYRDSGVLDYAGLGGHEVMDYTWLAWAVLLIVQNMAFTLVSRARNSKSLWYNAGASVASNLIWFASQFILIDQFIKVLKDSDWTRACILAAIYTTCTVIGSVSMQWFAINKIEKGVK